MGNALHRSQEGHELDKLKLAHTRLLAEYRKAQDESRERAIADGLEIERLKARNLELSQANFKLEVIARGHSSDWRGLFRRWFGFGRAAT